MKKTLLLTILFSINMVIILNVNLFGQEQSSYEPLWGLSQHYAEDVADLALARMIEISSADTNEIIIPWYHQDSIWRGLSAIFNTTTFSARDSIFDIFCIHDGINYASPSYPAIYIRYDTTFSWTHSW